MKKFISVVVILTLLTLTACETTGPKTAIGAAAGAAGGGLLAAAVGGNGVGIAAGTILGGLVGGVVGDRLDAADRKQAALAQQNALETAPTGQSVPWHNPNSGHSGYVTPTRTYQQTSGLYCREYTHVITVEGKEQRAYGTACRQADGEWRVTQ